jgi:guanosine-3',5'-bis(diphosphate) 3'-pyrophosphohydrolase
LASSRTKHLEATLQKLNYRSSLKAFDLVVDVMNTENGFSRHNGTHYYFHLVDVAQKLINFGICSSEKSLVPSRVSDEDIITAALLHDIVEDVDGYTISFVEEHFGSNVALMVDLVTKKAHIDYKEVHNLQVYLDVISTHYGASLIKTCDRMHNFGTLKDATTEKKLRYALENRDYFIPFFKVCRKKFPRYQNIFFEAKTQIEPFIYEYIHYFQEIQRLNKEIESLKEQVNRGE